MKFRTQKLLQAGICLLYFIVDWRNFVGIRGTEFSAGRITGLVLDAHDAGLFLLVLALLLTFTYQRIAAAMGILAALMCLPLYLYFVAPGPFRKVFQGEYSVPLQSNFVWDKWIILRLLILMSVISICLWSVVASKRANAPKIVAK